MSNNQAFVITVASIYVLWNLLRPPAGTSVVQDAIREAAWFTMIGVVLLFTRGTTYLLQLHDVVWFFLEMACVVTAIMIWTYRVEPRLGWSRLGDVGWWHC